VEPDQGFLNVGRNNRGSGSFPVPKRHARWPWLAAFVFLAIVLTGAIAAGGSAGKSESGIYASIDRLNVEKHLWRP
jgi:hypothetical protein